jgi:hypothetical protein
LNQRPLGPPAEVNCLSMRPLASEPSIVSMAVDDLDASVGTTAVPRGRRKASRPVFPYALPARRTASARLPLGVRGRKVPPVESNGRPAWRAGAA